MRPPVYIMCLKQSIIKVAVVILCFSNKIAAQHKNLDYFICQALSNSPLIKDYKTWAYFNDIDSQRLRATYKPQVTATASNSTTPGIEGWGYDPAITNINNVTDVVNVNKAFIGRGHLYAQNRRFSLTFDSLCQAKKISEQDLKKTVTAQYITVYGDLQQLNFYREVNDLLGQQELILRKLTRDNTYRQTDYLTFLVTLKQQEIQLKQLRIQFSNDYAMLNYLCGIVDTTTDIVDPPQIALQSLPESYSSVFFLRYQTDSLMLRNEIRINNYNYRPKLSAYANAGYTSSIFYQAYKDFGFGIGMNLNVPIYDGHQRLMQLQKIKLLEERNAYHRDMFTRQYEQQTAMLRQQLASTEMLLDDIRGQISYAEGLIKVNNQLLETGDARIADYIIAINNFLTARNLLTQNNISRMQIINQLNYWNR